MLSSRHYICGVTSSIVSVELVPSLSQMLESWSNLIALSNRNPRTITADAMAVEAMEKMESPPSPVQFLPVVNDNNVVCGIITLHGLVSAGL
jgi:CBS domain-containing protein